MKSKPSLTPHFRPHDVAPAVPLGIVRSPLFSVAEPTCRGVLYRAAKGVVMQAQRGERLDFYGPALGQQHALAWQAVLQAAGGLEGMDGRSFEVSPDMLLRDMGGKGGDTSQRERLAAWLCDLSRTRIRYRTRLNSFTGPLVHSVAMTVSRRQLVLQLDPQLQTILSNEVLMNDLARKARLGRHGVALWLHDFLASHLRPPADPVERLRDLSGSHLTVPQFRIRLREALVRLSSGPSALVIHGEIDRWDRLVIHRKAKTRVVIKEPEQRLVPPKT